MKLAKYVKKVQASLEAERFDALRADLECGDLSDTQLAINDHAEQSADYARQLVELTGDARETDSDAVEMADMESRITAAVEGIRMVNANGGFSVESLPWAQRAVDAILSPLGISVSLSNTALESLTENQTAPVAVESIEEVIEVIGATRQEVEALSVDGILRILDVLEEALPEVKDRLVALQQSISTLSYDEEVEITLDDLICKSLAVNGQLPVGQREYFAGYRNFANTILSSYSENALEAADKTDGLVNALCQLDVNASPIDAVAKAMGEIGDPRKCIDSDQLMFVLPGSGPLFGNKVVEEVEDGTGEEEEVDVIEPTPTEPAAAEVVEPAPDVAVVPAEEPAPAVPEAASVVPPVEGESGTAPAAEPVEPVEPVADDATLPSEPATAPVEAPAAPVPAPEPTAPAEGEEEEEALDENGNPIKPAKEAFAPPSDQPVMSPVEVLVVKLEKFSTNFAPLDPLGWEDRPDVAQKTIRVLSKDTIEAVTGELIKALEIVNIKSFGESHRQTWTKARSAFGAYRQVFDKLSPQQSADLAPATPAVGEYLNTVFTLSAWPALHVLTNLVFTANAFLLLAERSISGQSAEEDTFVPDDDGDDTVLDDADAATAGQDVNDAMAGSRAADIGTSGSVTSTT